MKIEFNGVKFEVVNSSIQQQIIALCLGQMNVAPIKEKRTKQTHVTWLPEDFNILEKALQNKHPIKDIVKFLNYKFTVNAVNAMAYKRYPTLIKAMTSGVPFGRV